MLRTSAYSLLGASALALSACTIHVNLGPAPSQAPPATPVATGRRPLPITRTAATPTVSPTTPVSVDRPIGTGPSLRGPRITGPVVFGNGQNGAFIGEAYVIPSGTQRLPNLSEFVPFATLFTDSFEVKSQTFSGGFPGALRQDDWFALRFEGDFLIEGDGVAEFALTADDGAALTIDGEKLIDNDGLHTATTVRGRRVLSRGAHRLRLDYFQGARGSVALSLDILAPGGRAPSAGMRPLVGINRTPAR